MTEETLYRSNIPKRPLRQRGNLSYLDFVRLIGRVWEEAHPDVPFLASGNPQEANYPCIVYALVNREKHPNEPKPKQREVLQDASDPNKSLMVLGQRFVNMIKFTVVDQVEPDGVQVAEELIEEFENFMIEYSPLFSELGLSDLVYQRRIPDDENPRTGEGIVRRAVVYRATIEKIITVDLQNLESVYATITIGSLADDNCDQDNQATTPIQVDLLETSD